MSDKSKARQIIETDEELAGMLDDIDAELAELTDEDEGLGDEGPDIFEPDAPPEEEANLSDGKIPRRERIRRVKDRAAKREKVEGGEKVAVGAGANGEITIKDLASELATEPKKLRKWLRSKALKPAGGRWGWTKDDPQLEEIRKEFKR